MNAIPFPDRHKNACCIQQYDQTTYPKPLGRYQFLSTIKREGYLFFFLCLFFLKRFLRL
jgi:hypothetical protein